MKAAFIIDAVRTPRARRKGKFSSVHPVDLLTYPLNAICERTKIAPKDVEDVVVGCVTQTAEQAWCIGRAAVLAAGWPDTVPASTVNRLCGSGQQAVNFIALGIMAGHYQMGVGAGVEHMTRVPMFSDAGGEESPFLKLHHPDLVQQGPAAELIAEKYKLSRSDVDHFALRSQKLAAKARAEGHFSKSLIPVKYRDEHGKEVQLAEDDNIRADTTIEGLGSLKTVFKENGCITAGNASAIVDGAAAVLLASEAQIIKQKLTPRARIVSISEVGSDPRLMLTGPVEASRQALLRANLKIDQIDLWEINEAFAPVPLITMRELEIEPGKVNVNGGGIALGHPLGATGAILIGTALDELERSNKRYALVTMCIGLGMGIATVIEKL